MFGGSDIFVLIIVFLAILTVFLGVKTVPQGYKWIYFVADKYLRALTEIAHSPNQKVLMFPVEATSVLATLVGIAEIIR